MTHRRGSIGGVTVGDGWLRNNPDLAYPDGHESMSDAELKDALKKPETDIEFPWGELVDVEQGIPVGQLSDFLSRQGNVRLLETAGKSNILHTHYVPIESDSLPCPVKNCNASNTQKKD